ncbi:MAG TPA: TolC family protein, partial [Polyangiaceae bacterium]|nr:TolC family protein [Polyangiaceae bacterium]
MVRFHRCAVLLVVVGWGVTVPARTDADQAPAPPSLPARLGLDQALDIVRTRGFDVLVADAQVRGAEGDLRAAQAVPNPALSFGYGRVLGYEAQLAGQDPNQYAAGLSDQAALFDSLWGKRSLRTDVARRALAASRMARQDALRTLEWQVKQQYAQVAQASAELRFAEQVVETTSGILALNRQRYPQVIDEGALARIETQKYEADQARDQAVLALRSGRVGLAFLLGARDAVPDFEVDASALDYRIPVALGNASEATLMRLALERRPDLLESRWEQARAQSASALARRQRLPDVTISAQYTQTGTGQNA